MKELWQSYSEKYINITPREQYLIMLTGLVAITFVLFSLFVDENLIRSEQFTKDIKQANSKINSQQQTINVFEQALVQDPNEKVNQQISQHEERLKQIDTTLLTLTSDLIDPVQMRFALMELLKMQQGVSLLSFDVVQAQPLTLAKNAQALEGKNALSEQQKTEQAAESLILYKHGIKLKLSGGYFQLRNYLIQLENLQWMFFWTKFDYQLTEYPNSELIIELYSLSTQREFIGV